MLKRVFFAIFILASFCYFSFSQKTTSKDPYADEPAVYVSTNGSDVNPGTKVLPFKTIEVAIDKAVIFGVTTIKVAEGVYTPGNGLNTGFSGAAIKHHNIKLIGGYSQDFESITGYSVLDGNRKIQAIIEVTGVTNALIENFIVTGTTNRDKTERKGGGIFLNNSSFSTVNNVISSNNQVGNGAGICVIGNNNTIKNSKSIANTGENGAGIYVVGNYNSITSSIIQSNTSSILGNTYISGVSNTISDSSISFNTTREGGGVYIDKGIGNKVVNSTINGNNALNSGGGIFVNIGAGNYINSTVKANNSRDGGGIYAFKTTSLLVEGEVSENNASRNGGGVALENCYKSTVNANIQKNTAGGSGGGVFLRGDETTISGTISGNYAKENGGGIYLITGLKNTINAKVQNNTADKNGGGIYVELAKSTSIKGALVSSNKSGNIGGGIFTLKDLDTTISESSVVNNTSRLHGGGIGIQDSTNSSLLSLDITQNLAEITNSIVYLYKTEGVINFVISNCTIGSVPGGKGFGIYEDGINDITYHKIIDNTFVESTLYRLYRDYYLDASAFITAVNNPKFSGASEARGNKVK
jgi:parallel beta-helix repeat protein